MLFFYFFGNLATGPMYYKGYYHIFYQYNPGKAVWGNITWGHGVSKDMVQWTFLHPALAPKEWYDIKGTWSGSVTIRPDGLPLIYYTGVCHQTPLLFSENMSTCSNKGLIVERLLMVFTDIQEQEVEFSILWIIVFVIVFLCQFSEIFCG